MGIVVGAAIKSARKAKGFNQTHVGDAAGVSYVAVGQWERGETNPTPEKLRLVGDFLGIDLFPALAQDAGGPDAIVPEPSGEVTKRITPNARRDPSAPSVRRALMGGGNLKVDIMGQAVCGPRSNADFRFNGQIAGRASRPSAISDLAGVFALYVMNDSLKPRYKSGDVVYVDPHRPPAIEDYVLIEMFGSDEGEPGEGYVKLLMKRTPTHYVVEQHNPPLELKFKRDEVKQLSRIIPWNELIGR